LAYWARGASGVRCGVVAFGLAGSGDAGGAGARSLRPVVSVAGFVAVVGRSPLIANTRNPATSTAATIAGTTQAGLVSIRGLVSMFLRAMSSFLRARSSFGSFNVICHSSRFLSSKRVKRPVAERVPVSEQGSRVRSTGDQARFFSGSASSTMEPPPRQDGGRLRFRRPSRRDISIETPRLRVVAARQRLRKHAHHVCAVRAFVGDQSRLICKRRDCHYILHCSSAPRAPGGRIALSLRFTKSPTTPAHCVTTLADCVGL